MTTLKTITTIELSSRCNLACKYCVNRLFKMFGRTPANMSDSVFERALDLLARLVRRGTQREVWLNGNGESLLDPHIAERMAAVMKVAGPDRVGLCTNGLLLDLGTARRLRYAGLQRIDISPHSPYDARKAVDACLEAGLNVLVNPGAIVRSHNWAGQLEPEHSVKIRFDLPCEPLAEGRGYVDSEGRMVPCCYDFRGLGAFGTVFDYDILEREIRPFALCETCHQGGGRGV